LVKCKAESAGKTYGTSGNKIGNGHLKWAFTPCVRIVVASINFINKQRAVSLNKWIIKGIQVNLKKQY